MTRPAHLAADILRTRTLRLSDRIVRQLPPPARGNKVTYDAEIKGFGCRVTAAGGRAFIINYRRKADGRERRFTIAHSPTGQQAQHAKRPNALSGRSMAVPILLANCWKAAPRRPSPIYAHDLKRSIYRANERQRSATTGNRLPSTLCQPSAA